MKGSRRRVLAALALLLATVACGGRESPVDVVAAYFAALDGDPARALVHLSDRFHQVHGLRHETFAQLDVPSSRAADGTDPAYDLYRARLGWLTTFSFRVFDELVRGLRSIPMEERITDDVRANVELVVEEWSGLRLTALAQLSRPDSAARWQIDAIEISSGTSVAEIALAFSVSPSLERFERFRAAQREGKLRKQRLPRGAAR